MLSMTTEFDKTILLSLLILSKGNTQFILEEDIFNKFPMRQRKYVRESLMKFEKEKLLKRYNLGYKLSKGGMKEASIVFTKGARFRL